MAKMHVPEDVYGEGPYEVYYYPRSGPDLDPSDPSLRIYSGTEGEMFKKNPITIREVQVSYVRMGSIRADGLEDAFLKMQGENWSPNGEANSFIRDSGTGHTSMSMGDVVHVGGRWWIADFIGFKELK